ncbi:OLC1v1007470C1 [Oldenlandia corymbosa var. corymbosa]|uniref:OLC1v1007470C1 n=1 Tax=Oldenlandia corymbosa var. corymbosa TaxID=529605 RepID=A0AAV1DKS8_OLDCO|nr:OLC1v1007470C1 [Oldenlandia corymbosa var. corymbosa]
MQENRGGSDGSVVECWGSPPNIPAASTVNNPDGFSRGNNTKAIWPNVKPFFNGFLAGQITALQMISVNWGHKKALDHMETFRNHPHFAQMKASWSTYQKRIPALLLLQATYTTARFGLFDYLTEKVKAANHGIPLSLYQEACCGLISGGFASFISYPLAVADASILVGNSLQSVKPNLNLRSVLFNQYLMVKNEGMLALWKGSYRCVTRCMFFNMGLLPSYHRSYSYFRESVGLDKTQAILGAGIVSAFIGTACSSSWSHISTLAHFINSESGKKCSYRDFLFLVAHHLRPGGKFKFYSGILKEFGWRTPVTLITWVNLEAVRGFEKHI